MSDYHDALIPLDIADRREPRVNAWDLHAFLGVGKAFGAWITERIAGIGFIQDQDFTVSEILSVPNSESSKARPQKTKQYLLSMDMAKELSMLERNEKGKQARRYFIKCEKRLRNMPTVPAESDLERVILRRSERTESNP